MLFVGGGVRKMSRLHYSFSFLEWVVSKDSPPDRREAVPGDPEDGCETQRGSESDCCTLASENMFTFLLFQCALDAMSFL